MLELNILAALSMLSVASYYDLKERSISDYLWLTFGSIGLLLLLFQGLPDTFAIASIVTSAGIALLATYLKLYGTADAFAIIVLAIILPTYNGVILPLAVLLGASILSLLFTCSFNLLINLRCLIKDRSLFTEFNEPVHRRIIAFFLLHKKREKERFAFAGEVNDSGRRRFRFINRADEEFVREGSYVTIAIPLTLFMLIALMLIIVASELPTDLFTL